MPPFVFGIDPSCFFALRSAAIPSASLRRQQPMQWSPSLQPADASWVCTEARKTKDRGSNEPPALVFERVGNRAIPAFYWSGKEDSNLRPLPPEDSALPG